MTIMKLIMKRKAFFLIIVIIFISCKKEVIPLKINQPPVADAGPDLIIVLPTDSVELRGIGTDADGSVVSYEWTTLSGPSMSAFINNNAPITKVKNLIEGIYVFELKV